MSKVAGVSLVDFADNAKVYVALVPLEDHQAQPTSSEHLLQSTSNESLTQLFSTIKDNSISTTVVAVGLAHGESKKSEFQQAASNAGFPFANTITHAGAYVFSMSPEDTCEYVLCIQAGPQIYFTILRTDVNSYDNNKRVYMVEHKITNVPASTAPQELLKSIPPYTLALVKRFVLLPPTVPTNLDTLADALRVASPNIDIVRPTYADLARGAAVNAAQYGLSKPLHQTTASKITLLPVSIATSDGSLLTVFGNLLRPPRTREITFTTAQEGQTKVCIPVLVGAYGSKLSEHDNERKVRTRVALDGLKAGKGEKPRVRIAIRVDHETRVEVKVEQIPQEGVDKETLPNVVVQLPGTINDASEEEIDHFNEFVELHPLVYVAEDKAAGELGDQ